MPRQRPSTASKSAAKPSSRTSTAPTTYDEWREHAVKALEQSHGVGRGVIPEGLWRKLYIQGLSPEAAADRAQVSAYNVRVSAERLRKRR